MNVKGAGKNMRGSNLGGLGRPLSVALALESTGNLTHGAGGTWGSFRDGRSQGGRGSSGGRSWKSLRSWTKHRQRMDDLEITGLIRGGGRSNRSSGLDAGPTEEDQSNTETMPQLVDGLRIVACPQEHIGERIDGRRSRIVVEGAKGESGRGLDPKRGGGPDPTVTRGAMDTRIH